MYYSNIRSTLYESLWNAIRIIAWCASYVTARRRAIIHSSGESTNLCEYYYITVDQGNVVEVWNLTGKRWEVKTGNPLKWKHCSPHFIMTEFGQLNLPVYLATRLTSESPSVVDPVAVSRDPWLFRYVVTSLGGLFHPRPARWNKDLQCHEKSPCQTFVPAMCHSRIEEVWPHHWVLSQSQNTSVERQYSPAVC